MPLLALDSHDAPDMAPVPAPVQALRDNARLELRRTARLAARYAQVPCVQVVFFDAKRGIWNLVEGSLDGVKPDARTLYADGHITDGIEIQSDLHAHDRWLKIVPPTARFFAGFVCHLAADPAKPGVAAPMAALCLWDAQPRVLRPEQVAFLSEFAGSLASPVVRFESEVSRSRTEARLSRIAESTPDAVILAAPDRRIVAVNPAFERLFGYAQSDVLGDTTERLYANPDDYALQGRLRYHPDADDREAPYRVTYRRADGTTFLGETVGVKIDDGADGYFGLIRDVTLQQEAEDTLRVARDDAEAAARLIRAFLANINHELRTPLTGLLGCAEWLRHEASPDLQQPLNLIHQSSRRLKTTLDSVLDLARIEAGEMPMQPEHFVPVHLLQAVMDELGGMARERALALRFEAHTEARVAEGSASVLSRIATHLVTNAIKFTDEGEVTVTLEPRADGLRLRVADTGCGIAPDFLPHVFSAFEQESDGWTRSHDGVGIGLTIAQRLTTLVGGTIEAESTVGAGSTFTVTLPCTWLPDAEVPSPLPAGAEVFLLTDNALSAGDGIPEARDEVPRVVAKPSVPSGPSAPGERAPRRDEAVPSRNEAVPRREPPLAEPSRAPVSPTTTPSPLAQPTSLLVVDPDETVCSLVGAYLMGICEVQVATTLDDALERADERPFDLLVLNPDTGSTLDPDRGGPETLLSQLRACAGTADAYAIALTPPGSGVPSGFDAVLRTPLDDMELVLTVGAALAG